MIYLVGDIVPWIISLAKVEVEHFNARLVLWIHRSQDHLEGGTDGIVFYKTAFVGEKLIPELPTGLVERHAFSDDEHEPDRIKVEFDMDAFIPWLEGEGLLIELENAVERVDRALR